MAHVKWERKHIIPAGRCFEMKKGFYLDCNCVSWIKAT